MLKADAATVLVVDDNLPTCRTLVRLLAYSGFKAKCVTSGREAIAFVATCEPKLVFLDVMMPEMDGFEVLQRIRATCPDVIVLMYSAVSDRTQRDRAISLGAHGYIVKGTGFSEIEAVIRSHLD